MWSRKGKGATCDKNIPLLDWGWDMGFFKYSFFSGKRFKKTQLIRKIVDKLFQSKRFMLRTYAMYDGLFYLWKEEIRSAKKKIEKKEKIKRRKKKTLTEYCLPPREYWQAFFFYLFIFFTHFRRFRGAGEEMGKKVGKRNEEVDEIMQQPLRFLLDTSRMFTPCTFLRRYQGAMLLVKEFFFLFSQSFRLIFLPFF